MLEKLIGKRGVLLVDNHQSKTPSEPSDDPGVLDKQPAAVNTSSQKPVEVGGQKGPEPTRYGDWEKAGRCTDF